MDKLEAHLRAIWGEIDRIAGVLDGLIRSGALPLEGGHPLVSQIEAAGNELDSLPLRYSANIGDPRIQPLLRQVGVRLRTVRADITDALGEDTDS